MAYVVRMIEENKPEIIWYYGHNYCHENIETAIHYKTEKEAEDAKETVLHMEEYRNRPGNEWMSKVIVDIVKVAE